MEMTAHGALPGWVPESARAYLAHVVDGVSIRALARQSGCHASTILRQVRRTETRRDDLLIDHALRRLGSRADRDGVSTKGVEPNETTASPIKAPVAVPDEETIEREGLRVLRRLAEPGACLAVAQGMEKSVVVRDGPDGQTIRTAVVETPVAEAMALKEWIATEKTGRIARYTLTNAGRTALKSMLDDNRADGAFGQSQDDELAQPEETRATAESPLQILARRREKDGTPFLAGDLVVAGERLREDFELARMEPGVRRNWDSYVLGGQSADETVTAGKGTGPSAAGARVQAALADLGPGLGDVVLRCCCYLEGMEHIEKRMGWAARSGKIVLRIGLQRLLRHYAEAGPGYGDLIG